MLSSYYLFNRQITEILQLAILKNSPLLKLILILEATKRVPAVSVNAGEALLKKATHSIVKTETKRNRIKKKVRN